MNVRFIDKPHIIGYASRFNVHALDEIEVGFLDGGADSCFTKDLEVEIEGEWITMREAFKTKELITDNGNTHFFRPPTPEDRERGYTL